MPIAFVFAGQAAQRDGMVSDWNDTPQAEVFNEVTAASGIDLHTTGDTAQACAASTAVAQPAIYAAALAAHDALVAAGITPDVVAGHSLGEVTAAVAAGVVDRADGAALVTERGRAMGQACAASPGTMAAILKLELQQVEALVADVADAAVANNNAPGQVVVAGTPEAVDEVVAKAKEAGARTKMLDVEGAFHSPAMSPAVVRLHDVLGRAATFDPTVPLVSGVDGATRTSASEVTQALVDGILSPVRWVDVQHALISDHDVDLVIECGPGQILAGCAKRTIRATTFLNVSTPDEVGTVVDHLAPAPA